MEKAFVNMPHVLVMDLLKELISEELNSRPVNKISGDLAGSFDKLQLGADKWAVSKIKPQAPYAQRVMVDIPLYTRGRLNRELGGKPVLVFLRDRRYPIYNKAIIAEFISMVKKANTTSYKWNPQTFDARLH